MDMRETRISGEYFFEGRIMKARVDEVRLPNGKQASREVCEHVGGVGVLPIDRDGNILLVRQFRYPFDHGNARNAGRKDGSRPGKRRGMRCA